ncbi:hypothetical protein DesLBE_0472 [Desulfitobacterium sp. LBE]|uniref:Uncharacterized protein n=2 Tax=Desulfitobacterium hafniense TaxID=49338 RepID=G9XU78_DESHA|nr:MULTISPECIES: hypothetical protein [Desulfitobacterium]ACL20902.1 hypothetical protein Dhaf_2879 [Desulfitobacterium hafniense DCB-2]EHL04755.1 hypothetical protein HMPREF0322_04536 [Desulfitobacterium hafniense DP7]TWH56274.1 hypothetical protein DesLBE_0472 [Desulfitobacterium sp. LBE]
MGKRVFFYLLYAVFFIILIQLGITYSFELKSFTSKTYNPYPAWTFNIALSVLIGLLLGLPEFIRRYKKPGKWRIQWERLLIVGLPALFFTFSLFIFFSSLGKYLSLILRPWAFESYGVIICGILFGYTMIMSMDKKGESPASLKGSPNQEHEEDS